MIQYIRNGLFFHRLHLEQFLDNTRYGIFNCVLTAKQIKKIINVVSLLLLDVVSLLLE